MNKGKQIRTQFVTFYSYKGGVGRTSALVNTAAHLAQQGSHVVTIDFDLEAPGLGSYLGKLKSSYDERTPGILEYLDDVIFGEKLPSLKALSVDFSEHLALGNGGALYAISAGDTSDPSYYSRLERLKWGEIFEHKHGELILRNLRNQLVEEFENPDYVLIDSRTGITETGGVCTRYLSDQVVVLSSLNEQNINGTAAIYRELASDKKSFVFVASNVPAGMPSGQGQLFTERVASFVQAFGKEPDIFVYYYPALSLEETIPVMTRNGLSAKLTDPLYQSYRSLSNTLELKNRNSFLRALEVAARDLRRVYIIKIRSDTSVEPELSSLETLLVNYPSRKLTHILREFYELAELVAANPNNPRKWGASRYKQICREAEAVDNRAIKLARDALVDYYDVALRRYVEKGRMSKPFELFALSHNHLVLTEIAKGNYDWPESFLERRLSAIDKGEESIRHEMAWVLFNLARVYDLKSKPRKANSLYARFLDIFGEVDGFGSLESQANAYACAALASSSLGRYDSRDHWARLATDSAASLPPDSMIFSPFVYREHPRERFIKEVAEKLSPTL